MPLDPSIITGIAEHGFSPLKALQNADVFAAQQEKNRAEAEQARQAQLDAQRQQMIDQTLRQFGGDADAAAEFLQPRDYQAASTLRMKQAEVRKKVAESWGAELDNAVKAGTITKAQFEAEQAARKSKDPREWIGLFAFADDQNYDQTKAAAKLMLGKDADQLLAILPPTAAEARAFASKMALGPEKVATLAGQQEGRDIQREGQQLTAETAAANRDVTMRGQDLTAATARRGQDVTAAGQRLTAQTAANRLAADRAAGGAAGGAGGAKLGVAAVEKVAAIDQSLGMLDDIERLAPQMGGNIGPLDQWLAKGRLKTGIGVRPELAQFDAQLTGLKNAVIKATTGAAMSEPEAQRIMGQLPDLGLPEPVFKARLETTRKNLQTLKRRTIELSGGSADQPAAPAAAAPADPLGIR